MDTGAHVTHNTQARTVDVEGGDLLDVVEDQGVAPQRHRPRQRPCMCECVCVCVLLLKYHGPVEGEWVCQ